MADRLFLASQSPRRRELIKLLGVPVEMLDPPGIDEGSFIEKYSGPINRLPVGLAEAKARLVLPKIEEGYLVCADTDVIHDGEVLGKPVDEEDAKRMLHRLSGEKHEVVTGIAVGKAPVGEIISAGSVTCVYFSELDDAEIDAYAASQEPMDKAGAYGIQGLAAPFIREISGCYFNVVGLPVNRLYMLLKQMGFSFD